MRVRMGMNGRPVVMTFYTSYFREERELKQCIERGECERQLEDGHEDCCVRFWVVVPPKMI